MSEQLLQNIQQEIKEMRKEISQLKEELWKLKHRVPSAVTPMPGWGFGRGNMENMPKFFINKD